MPSAAAQDVLQAMLEQRAAEKRREMAGVQGFGSVSTSPAVEAPVMLPFARQVENLAPSRLPFAGGRIAGAFEAAQPVRQVDELSAPITLPFAARNQLGDWHGRMPNVVKVMTDPRTSPFGPAAVARLFMDPAGEAGRQVETGEQLAKPFTQFNDPNVDPVKQGADLAMTVMGGSAAVPAEANSLQAGLKIFSPYSKLGQNIPVTETAPIYVSGSGPKLIEKTFDPMTLKPGDRIVGFVGDRSHTGEDLGGIDIAGKRVMFKKPVQSEGGAGYMSHEFNPQDAVWASNVGPATTQAKRLSAHLENAEGDVYGATMAMAAPGIDFSVQGTKTALETLRAQPLAKEAREALYDAIDEAMAAPIGNGKDFPAIPDWPGVRTVIKDDRLLQRIPGKWRAKLMKRLDADPLKRLGAPNMAAVRYAVTAPGQRNASVLESGHGWFKMGDEAKRLSPEEVIRGHKTYPFVTASPGGEYAGTRPMPVDLVFPGLARKVRHMNASGQQRTASMQDVYEVVTPRQLERFQRWLESEKGKQLGIAGAVAAGLLTAAQADALFGEDQTDRPKA